MPPTALDAVDPPPDPRGEPLVPLLRAEQLLGDPDAVATWHTALSSAIAPDIPHDLLGLWLYPTDGGSVLLAPEALSQDDLGVPIPEPRIEPAQTALLREIVRDAGYGSVACLAIGSGRRDVGLLLVAGLSAGLYGAAEQHMLDLVAQRLAPLFGRLARQWHAGEERAAPVARLAALVDALAFADPQVGSPQWLVAELSRAVEPLLPHDRLELLLADRDGGRVYRLGEHAAGPLWSDPSLVLARQDCDFTALFGGRNTLLLPDTYQEPHWPRGYFTVTQPEGAEVRGMVGARLSSGGETLAYLLAGSAGADLYDEADAALLERVAGLVAPRVALLVAAAAPPGGGPALIDAAAMLATSAAFGDATRQVADLAARLIPFDDLRFAIRLSEGDRVVLVEPGERRSLPDLPLIPVAGTTLAAVLSGDLEQSFQVVDGEARLLVPLRVAGRVHGALVLTARYPAILRDVHLQPAQQLADVMAAHLELLRRTALLPPPYLPGWKKVR